MLADRPTYRSCTAEATLRARAFYYQSIEAAWSVAERGDKVVGSRRDIRLATTHAVEASIRVVNAMYTLGGGSGIWTSLQRHLRDVHMTSQHIMVAPQHLRPSVAVPRRRGMIATLCARCLIFARREPSRHQRLWWFQG